MTESCLYTGTIAHHRTEPDGGFRHPLTLAYLDLDELPGLLDGRLLHRGPGLLRFRRRDYLGDPATDLATAVADRVAALRGERPTGPIRLLTGLRSWGVCFNPVSFYYCFKPDGHRLDCVLAEVTNTPWGERQAYLIQADPTRPALAAATVAKQMHVSPFQPMDHDYEVQATAPQGALSVRIANRSQTTGRTVFEAMLQLRRRPLTQRTATRLSLTSPAASIRVLALIYGHALGLAVHGAGYHPHPEAAR